MNLATMVSDGLWEAVRLNYEKRDFTNAILDAFYFLSDLLRKKSGAEGDGSSLIGQALGGASPKIKLNRLQSESEWNLQKGMEQMLRGFYQAIRNPRSHEKMTDTEDDAQTIILFIGYLVNKIDQAKSQFSRADYLKRVFDADFVPQKRYAELLVEQIPTGQRLEVFLDVYRAKETGVIHNLRTFFSALIPKLSSDDVIQVHEVVSEELRTVEDEDTIRFAIGSLNPSLWPNYEEDARLRIENKLIKSVKSGRYDSKQDVCRAGSLGTWSSSLLPHFTLKDEMLAVISEKLRSDVQSQEDYVFNYLWRSLLALSAKMPVGLKIVFKRKLKAGDIRFKRALSSEMPWKKEGWDDDLEMEYNNFKEADQATFDDDDIPF